MAGMARREKEFFPLTLREENGGGQVFIASCYPNGQEGTNV